MVYRFGADIQHDNGENVNKDGLRRFVRERP
jgi:hypothetical protein